MKFGITDFNEVANVDRLRVIIMSEMEYHPLRGFKSLPPKKKKQFNILLNDYISKLPEENWDKKLQEDFNEVCVAEIFDDDFDASKIGVCRGTYPEEEAKAEEENETIYAELLNAEKRADLDKPVEELENETVKM